MSDKDMLDKIFDSVLYEALKEVESEPNPDLPEETSAGFSEEHKKNMRNLFAGERKRLRRRNLYKPLKYAAACVGIAVVISGAAAMSADAIRVRIMNFLLDRQETNTEITLSEKTYENGYIVGNITLGYIPAGFEMETQRDAGSETYLKFANPENDTVSIIISDAGGVHSVDTENADTEEMTVNGDKALYSEKDGLHMMIMYSDKGAITIQSKIPREEIVKIAQNIEID